MRALTTPQKTILWNCILKKNRGFIAYGNAKVTARSLAKRRLIQRAPHNILFPWGHRERPWMITAKGLFAYHGIPKLPSAEG